MVLTELCMALSPLPALKGELIVREGQKGYEMYCIESGACRVTQHLRGSDDVIRIKTWIEETIQAKGTPLVLFDPNQRDHLERLLRRMKVMARKKLSTWRRLSAEIEELEVELGSRRDPSWVVPHEVETTLENTRKKLMQMGTQNLTYVDMHDDNDIDQVRHCSSHIPVRVQ
jgi:hypothetical protein